MDEIDFHEEFEKWYSGTHGPEDWFPFKEEVKKAFMAGVNVMVKLSLPSRSKSVTLPNDYPAPGE